jgi:DNA-binding NarL/FixJ family response regulator
VIGVLLVDDQALVRAGFRALLRAQPDIDVVGEAEDGTTAVTMARDTKPDVVLMDIRMPGRNGLDATKDIVADPRLTGVKVIVLTTFAEDAYVFDAIRNGASGFLVKDSALLGQLTEREREVVALVAAGLSNDEIAERLVVSPATAKTHVSRAMIKLAARDRAQVVVLAYESGLVRPGWTG